MQMTTQAPLNDVDHIVKKINDQKVQSWLILTMVALLRNFLLATIFVGIWSLLRPDEYMQQLYIGSFTFIIMTLSGGRFKKNLIDKKNLQISMEIRYSHTKHPLMHLDHPHYNVEASQEWKSLFDKELSRIRILEFKKIKNSLSSIILPLMISGFILGFAPISIGKSLTQVANMVLSLKKSAHFTIVQGGNETDNGKTFDLKASNPIELELNNKNTVKITMTDLGGKEAPTVILKRFDSIKKSEEIYQSFQLSPVNSNQIIENEINEFELDFSITESVQIYIPKISASDPVVKINLKILPVPKVHLVLEPEKIKTPWPDEKPLGLRIIAKGTNPLKQVNLIIHNGKQESKETIFNVLTEDVHDIDKLHSIILEQYVEADLSQVEITAEVIDRATPVPLIGYSESITVQTASAYGRYKNTLTTLKEFKSILDTNISKQDLSLTNEAKELTDKAQMQSGDSPFFDGLDRIEIAKFSRLANENIKKPNMENLIELSSSLNLFLTEHETLDQRERDRDFFVAARALSRLLEKSKSDRPVSVTSVATRLNTFLDEREQIWTLRVALLQDQIPKSWHHIKNNRPFHKALAEIISNDKKDQDVESSLSLEILAKTVTEYRDWINELEDTEDKAREQKEEERQQGLANARDEIRELQKKQGHISSKLDKAQTKSKEDLESQWPMALIEQNSNIKDTEALENKMRSLSPEAAIRMKAAHEAMRSTKDAGIDSDFVTAESQSDFAGRLLRQANSAAQQSQKQSQQSRGRRKRVVGDNYYGKNVMGGDVEIKRDYQVDRRYREDILEDVSSRQNTSEEDETILNGYLREVVR